MRTLIAATVLAIASLPAWAQPPTPREPLTPEQAQEREHPTGVKPVDVGPYTPEANRAYNGGGVVLQGAPGAPAPKPQALPPGGLQPPAAPH